MLKIKGGGVTVSCLIPLSTIYSYIVFSVYTNDYWLSIYQIGSKKWLPHSNIWYLKKNSILLKSGYIECLKKGCYSQALVSFKKYMPPPLPYFKVNICPFPLPHFASIFFADPIISLHSRDISLFDCHIYTYLRGPPQKNWTRIFSERRIFYFSVIESDTATSGLRWIFHIHSEFSRPARGNNAIMIISSQM